MEELLQLANHYLGAGWQSTIIALFALLLTFGQLHTNRKHNRLSVQPHLTSWLYEDEKDKNYIIKALLLNKGIGPALVDEVKVYYQGKMIGDNSDRNKLYDKIDAIIDDQNFGHVRKDITTLGKNYALSSGEKLCLLGLTAPLHLSFERKIFQDFVDRFDIKIKYKSMYGVRAPEFDSKKEKLR
jgi:hypothetical protein